MTTSSKGLGLCSLRRMKKTVEWEEWNGGWRGWFVGNAGYALVRVSGRSCVSVQRSMWRCEEAWGRRDLVRQKLYLSYHTSCCLVAKAWAISNKAESAPKSLGAEVWWEMISKFDWRRTRRSNAVLLQKSQRRSFARRRSHKAKDKSPLACLLASSIHFSFHAPWQCALFTWWPSQIWYIHL